MPIDDSWMNPIVRLVLKKGIVLDLARIPHSLDLSSPHLPMTVNTMLKPLDTLSRIINLPQAMIPSTRSGSKLKAAGEGGMESAATEEVPSVPTGTVTFLEHSFLFLHPGDILMYDPITFAGFSGTSTSEAATHAQGEEIVGDTDNTEHDLSAATESLDPVSVSEGHVPETNDLDDIIHVLLGRCVDSLTFKF